MSSLNLFFLCRRKILPDNPSFLEICVQRIGIRHNASFLRGKVLKFLMYKGE